MSSSARPVRERGIRRKPRPLFERRDLHVAAELASLVPVAWLRDEPAWERTAWRRARRKAAHETGLEPRRTLEQLATRCPLALDPETLLVHRHAFRLQQFLQYLREWRPGGWRPRILTAGAERLHEIVVRGRGAVLWVAPFVSSNLIAKMAVHAMGLSTRHLSDAYHGPTSSQLGRLMINPLEVAIDSRYVERRYELAAGNEVGVVRQLCRDLSNGAVISISHEPIGRQVLRLPMLGGAVAIPTAPAGLSAATGVPLFAVFTHSRGAGEGFEVAIEGPLEASGGGRRKRVERLVGVYREHLESHVRRQPLGYREWLALARGIQ